MARGMRTNSYTESLLYLASRITAFLVPLRVMTDCVHLAAVPICRESGTAILVQYIMLCTGYLLSLKKPLQMIGLGSQTHVTPNKHVDFCASDFHDLSDRN